MVRIEDRYGRESMMLFEKHVDEPRTNSNLVGVLISAPHLRTSGSWRGFAVLPPEILCSTVGGRGLPDY